MQLVQHGVVARVGAGLLTLCLSACDSEVERLPATQITVRVYPAEEVRAGMAQLHVRSYRERSGFTSPRGERWFDRSEIGPVVDVVLAATLASLDEGGLAVVVDAVDRKGKVLAQTRATFEFVRSERRLLELWLYPCAGRALGMLCSDADCQGKECLTCVDDTCAPTPHYSSRVLSTVEEDEPPPPPKPPPWSSLLDGAAPGACEAEGCAGSEGGPNLGEAGSDGGAFGYDAGDGSALDAGADGGPFDAGAAADSGSDASFDAGTDASRDGGLDAGTEAGLDAGHDAAIDGGRDASHDSSMEDRVVPPPPPPPGRCADSGAWTTVGFAGLIPARAARLAGHTSSDRGSLPQYVCRVTTPDNNLTPAKVSQDPAAATRFDFGCFAAYQDGARWLPYENFDTSSRFEVLTPPSDCTLGWATVPAAGPLPARALATGRTVGGAPLYTCRITINRNEGSVMRMGTHLGRVSATAGEPCRVQYYGGVDEVRPPFEVLTQEGL